MRLRHWLVIVVVVAAGLVAAQIAVQRVAQSRMQTLLASWRGWADIEVGSSHFWLWGVADLDDVRVTPTAWLGALYGLPLGYTVEIQTMRLHRPRLAWDGGPRLASVDVDARAVHLPLPQWRWTVVLARGANGKPLVAPTLQSLGLHALEFDLHLRARFPGGISKPRVRAQAGIRGLGRLALDCRLRIPAGAAADPGAIVIRRCRLDYRDLGLAKRIELAMAKRNDMSLPAVQAAIQRQLERGAGKAHWPAPSTQAAAAFIRDPALGVRLRMVPPRPLALSAIPRGIWPGLPALLGLTAESLPTQRSGEG